MNDELSKWSHLWTTEAKDYVLICPMAEREAEKFSIFSLSKRVFLLIEDDSLGFRIVQEMRRAGVPVLDKPPADPIDQIVEEMFAARKSLNDINRKRKGLLRERSNKGK